MITMNKIQVRLDTGEDVREFVNIACSISEPVYLEDGTTFRASAKSLMGVMYGKFEFETLYVLSDNKFLASKFMKFLV